MCVDAMVLHVEASKVLSNNVKLKNSNIFNLEDMLLTGCCIWNCGLYILLCFNEHHNR